MKVKKKCLSVSCQDPTLRDYINLTMRMRRTVQKKCKVAWCYRASLDTRSIGIDIDGYECIVAIHAMSVN